jgi:hypothetical protein
MSFLVGLRRDETHVFAVLLFPLHDSFEMEAPGTTAKLLYHATVTGVASIDVLELNSGEMHWLRGEDRGEWREIERIMEV